MEFKVPPDVTGKKEIRAAVDECVMGLSAGARVRYHTGFLMKDRCHDEKLNIAARRFWEHGIPKEYDVTSSRPPKGTGRGLVYQERYGVDDYEYYFRKRERRLR